MKRIALGLCLLLALSSAVGAAPSKAPRDDTDRIPGFAPFAARLKQAVAARDAAFIRALMLPDTLAGYTIHDFKLSEQEKQTRRQSWARSLDDPEAQFWKEMDLYLRWGVRWDEHQSEAVYPNVDWGLPGSIVVTGTGVNVRESPSRSSRVLGTLSWQCLEFRHSGSPPPWLVSRGRYYAKIQLSDGKVGYVHNDFTWGGGSTVTFKQVNGEWKLSSYGNPG